MITTLLTKVNLWFLLFLNFIFSYCKTAKFAVLTVVAFSPREMKNSSHNRFCGERWEFLHTGVAVTLVQNAVYELLYVLLASKNTYLLYSFESTQFCQFNCLKVFNKSFLLCISKCKQKKPQQNNFSDTQLDLQQKFQTNFMGIALS